MEMTLTDEMRSALDVRPDEPVQFTDPATETQYVLLRADVYQRLQGRGGSHEPADSPAAFEIPPGIRIAKEAFLRDLPDLLRDRRLRDWWALYHGSERVVVARTHRDVVAEYLRRGLARDEVYFGKIADYSLDDGEVFEMDRSFFEFEEIEPEASDGRST